jgi:hypothetical protein
LRGGIRDKGLLSGDYVIVVFLTKLKRNVLMRSLPERLAPNPYCLRMEDSMVIHDQQRGVAFIELAIGKRELY